MVQRKGPDIACQKTEPKKGGLKQEKHHPLQDQDTRKLRKARSIKRISELDDLEVHLGHQHLQPSSKAKKQLPPRLAPPNSTKKQLPPISRPTEVVIVSPNYMNPTTSSDARKERSQVIITHESSASDKKRNPVLVKKPAEFLARKSSLKPVRTVTKKCPAAPLFPEVSTSKATCSSILKDSRFPKELELAPGSTEAEGTSTMKVCPFTYCSLNGHWHQPLPPLRSFISARRRLLKTQKSIKLKSLTSCRRRCSKKSGKLPTEEDLGEDFFVEIYANSYEESAESAVIELSNYGDDEEDCDYDMDSETFSELLDASTKKVLTSSSDGCYSEISYDDGIDKKGEFSASEKEVLAGFLEFIENQEDEAETPDGENCKWEDGGYLSMDSSDIGEQLSDTEAYEALLEAIDVNREDSDDVRSVEGGLGDCSSEHDQRNKYTDQELEFLQSICGDEFSDQNSEESVGELPYGDDNQVESDRSQIMDEFFFSLVLMGLEEDSVEEVMDDREFKSEKDHDENVSLEDMEFLGQLFSESTRELEEEGESEVLEIKSMVEYEVAKESYFPEDAFSSTEAEAGFEVEAHEQDKDHVVAFDENGSSEELDFLEHLISESTQDFEEKCATEMVNDEVLENPHLLEEAFSSTEAGFGVRIHEQLEDHVVDCEKDARSEEIEFLEHLFSESNQELEEQCATEVTETKAMVGDVVPGDPDLPEDAFNSTEAEEEFGVRICEQHKDHIINTSKGVHTKAAAHEEATNDPNLSENAYDHQMESGKTYENAEESCSCVDNGTRTGDCTENIDGQTRCQHRNCYACNSKQSPKENDDELRLKLNIIRRNIGEDSDDELKAFNPRAPNFLEVEPDPEAEKVDLRHQMADERKSAEEWMIDHALQEVVNKLAPARKKKVALIVEAIETVAPMHTYQPALKHGGDDFPRQDPCKLAVSPGKKTL